MNKSRPVSKPNLNLIDQKKRNPLALLLFSNKIEVCIKISGDHLAENGLTHTHTHTRSQMAHKRNRMTNLVQKKN